MRLPGLSKLIDDSSSLMDAAPCRVGQVQQGEVEQGHCQRAHIVVHGSEGEPTRD
jgi:hypothetical protein